MKVDLHRKREIRREKSSIHWFILQKASMAGAETIQSQEPGASLESPT